MLELLNFSLEGYENQLGLDDAPFLRDLFDAHALVEEDSTSLHLQNETCKRSYQRKVEMKRRAPLQETGPSFQ